MNLSLTALCPQQRLLKRGESADLSSNAGLTCALVGARAGEVVKYHTSWAFLDGAVPAMAPNIFVLVVCF